MSLIADSILSHVSVGTNDLTKALAFYDAVMRTINVERYVEHDGAVAYGRGYPEFWVQQAFDGNPATVGNGTHIGFIADSSAQVDAFYKAALESGGTDNGKPGPRPHYGEPYYGCFVLDPDGNRIEATFWDEAAQ